MPVRFVRACRCGHIGDIDWRDFVHGEQNDCMRQLWMDERGTSGDLSEVFVRCECKAERNMIQAHACFEHELLATATAPALGLAPSPRNLAANRIVLLIRTASNAYFPQLMSVISLPDRDETVKASRRCRLGIFGRGRGPVSNSNTSGKRPK